MPPSSSYFDPERRERARRRLLKRGAMLSMLLTEVLAGKDRTPVLLALGILTPGIRPKDALRKALDQVERGRLLLVSDDDRYGSCTVCGMGLRAAALEEVPWADRCPSHAAAVG